MKLNKTDVYYKIILCCWVSDSVWAAAGSVQSLWLWLTEVFVRLFITVWTHHHCGNSDSNNVQHLQSGLHWWSEWNQSPHILHHWIDWNCCQLSLGVSPGFCWYQAKPQPVIPGSVLHSIVASCPSETVRTSGWVTVIPLDAADNNIICV